MALIVPFVGSIAYLYLSLFSLRNIPFLLGGDQVFFWTYAERILQGELPYRDFFQFTPPGTDLVYLAAFKLLGSHIWVTNAIVFALGLVLFWICFTLAQEVLERPAALLAAFFFLIVVYGQLLNGTHHWFSFLAVMCAAKTGMREWTPARVLIIGSLLGIASFFTQTRGVAGVAAIVTVLMLERYCTKSSWNKLLTNVGLLVGAFFAALMLCSSYFIASVGWKPLWYCQVTYVREQLLRVSIPGLFLGLPMVPTWHTIPRLSPYLAVYAIVGLSYPLVLWQIWLKRRNDNFPTKQLGILSLAGLFLLVEVAGSLNWLRLYTVAMPAVILSVWFATRILHMGRRAATFAWIAVSLFALFQVASSHRAHSSISRLPAGAAATAPAIDQKLSWILEHTQPGDLVFQAPWPGIYFPLHLQNPLYLDIVGPANPVRPQDIAFAIQQLDQKHVTQVIWSKSLNLPNFDHQDPLLPLRNYLYQDYVCMHTFPDGETIWRRK